MPERGGRSFTREDGGKKKHVIFFLLHDRPVAEIPATCEFFFGVFNVIKKNLRLGSYLNDIHSPQ